MLGFNIGQASHLCVDSGPETSQNALEDCLLSLTQLICPAALQWMSWPGVPSVLDREEAEHRLGLEVSLLQSVRLD